MFSDYPAYYLLNNKDFPIMGRFSDAEDKLRQVPESINGVYITYI